MQDESDALQDAASSERDDRRVPVGTLRSSHSACDSDDCRSPDSRHSSRSQCVDRVDPRGTDGPRCSSHSGGQDDRRGPVGPRCSSRSPRDDRRGLMGLVVLLVHHMMIVVVKLGLVTLDFTETVMIAAACIVKDNRLLLISSHRLLGYLIPFCGLPGSLDPFLQTSGFS